MTIIYVSDDNYAHLLGISILSLYDNNREVRDLRVYVIDDGISQKNKEKIKLTARQYDREIMFFNVDLAIRVKEVGKWPNNIFYRLFFLSILGDELSDNRVLYLDCDTVIAENIENLWDVDMEGDVCAAVYECMSKKHKKNCGLSDDLPYFNSGVLLIDVNKWRELGVERRVREIIDININTKMEYPDEGIMNYVLSDNITALKPCYNLTTIKCVFSYRELKIYRKSKYMYSENDYSEAKAKPCIIHYTNNFLVRRPWYEGMGYEHPLAQYFIKYKECSLWKDVDNPPEHIGVGGKIFRRMFEINRMLSVAITGIIYSYIKPLKYDVIVVEKK